ncbi:hypothetical protein IscW_ISCW000453 [Ixodes scapularis]|uniref:Ig-like domain-containing protein n=1 Tax=Ixodes scapularis TaxID=6945 RepID=B7P4X1_IXOSC|nr:hypothetical protein IscW_ISCW000453 [Ixodes scapularis]|eukprot:XP_002406540.1 hypothetical protein IscW_ISCW000453 [Ixodes scapularis]
MVPSERPHEGGFPRVSPFKWRSALLKRRGRAKLGSMPLSRALAKQARAREQCVLSSPARPGPTQHGPCKPLRGKLFQDNDEVIVEVKHVFKAHIRTSTTGVCASSPIDPSGATVVTSRVGGDAALPCELRHSAQNSWASAVTWFKRGLPAPVYSVDMGSRSGNFLQATHQPGLVWSGRAYFSSADEPALLMIGDVEAADAGLYVCLAAFGSGHSRNTSVRFVVVGASCFLQLPSLSENKAFLSFVTKRRIHPPPRFPRPETLEIPSWEVLKISAPLLMFQNSGVVFGSSTLLFGQDHRSQGGYYLQ